MKFPRLKKYFFGILVIAYVATAAGIPVYLHYCGGELEEVSYLVKSNGCCGDEETSEDNGCCKNEHLVLQSLADFTFKDVSKSQLVKSSVDLFSLPVQNRMPPVNGRHLLVSYQKNNPPPLLHGLVISTSVIRV